MNLLELRAIAAGYGPSQVLFGVDLDVPQGAMVTLLGRNGMKPDGATSPSVLSVIARIVGRQQPTPAMLAAFRKETRQQ